VVDVAQGNQRLHRDAEVAAGAVVGLEADEKECGYLLAPHLDCRVRVDLVRSAGCGHLLVELANVAA
jgi:hypothetical protein